MKLLFILALAIGAVCAEEASQFIRCIRPVCGAEEVDRKWPVEDDPSNYYECVPSKDGYEAIMRPCESGLWFDFRQQQCVEQSQWEEVCVAEESGEGCGCTGESETSEETDEPCENCTCTEESGSSEAGSGSKSKESGSRESGSKSGSKSKESGSRESGSKSKESGSKSKESKESGSKSKESKESGSKSKESKESGSKSKESKESGSKSKESSSEEGGGCNTEPPLPPPPKNPECGAPKCDCKENSDYLWPGKTPRQYYICVLCGENQWVPQLNQCEDPIVSHFSYSLQACVRANEWKNECRKGPSFVSILPRADDLIVFN